MSVPRTSKPCKIYSTDRAITLTDFSYICVVTQLIYITGYVVNVHARDCQGSDVDSWLDTDSLRRSIVRL